MDEPILSDEIKTSEEENTSLHIEALECNCAECRNRKKHYVQIIDMDRYINALNDWD